MKCLRLMARVLRHLKILQILFLILGLVLFYYVVSSVGLHQITESIRLMGFGFVIVLAISAVRHWLRSVAWLHCIEEDHRNIRLMDLFNVRLAGDAVRLLSFTGPFLGETSKAMLIRKRLPMIHGMSSIIIENLAYTVGVIIVVISGLGLLMANFSTKTSVKIMGGTLTFGMLVAVIGVHYVISRRIKAFTRLGAWLAAKTDIQWFKTSLHSIGHTEDKVHDFYERRSSAFYIVLALEFAANIVNIFEVYLILYFIGASVTPLTSFIVEAMMKVVNILFFFVPGQVGVMEGGNAILLKMLGMGVSAGVTLSLIEKIRAIFWAAYGLFIWMYAFQKGRNEAKNKMAITELAGKEVIE
jgi:Lysylphosphatidylglycerol synthase TM region